MQNLPTGQAVITFLGWPSDPSLVLQADQHVQSAALHVRTYVRRVGFSEDATQAEDDLCAVIVSAAARSLSNPAQVKRVEAGSFNEAPGSFYGFTLAELGILHHYRRRTN